MDKSCPHRTIFHIDFDSFFASCEQQLNPLFRNKPLGVTATNGRTCIIAASREAKKTGIKTGTRSWEAKKICPEIILTPANFVEYLEVSKKFLKICKDYSPLVELFSIDELFIDATPTLHLFGGVDGIIAKIKTRIKNEIGEFITASFGVSHNKLLAKLASGLNKPNGITKINEENIYEIYKKSELTDVCGIGERIKIRLNKIGIYNLLQLRNVSLEKLTAEFGKVEGKFLKNIGLAKDESEVIPYTVIAPVKSVGRNYCLPQNEYNKNVILQNVFELCEEISIKLRRLRKKSRTVGIYLSGNIVIKGRKTYPGYFDTGKEIFDRIKPFITEEFYLSKNYIRQIHVWASNLEDKQNLTFSLFPSEEKKTTVTRIVDKINDKFGDHTIRNAFLIYAEKLTTVPNGYGADKYDRMKIADI